MSVTAPRTKRWTRVQYERAINCGIFRPDERLELVNGALVVREPQGDPHAAAIDLVVDALRRAFGEGWVVRAQAPMALGRVSRPEPDVSVVRGPVRQYWHRSPHAAALVVEVSDSTLRFDRGEKAVMYARQGVADYWIVNLVDMMLEVYRDPGPASAPRRARGYQSVERLARGSFISPLAAPGVRIDVSDLME